MSDANAIRDILTAAIQTKVIEALNDQSGTIDKLVTAALTGKVDDEGKPDRYGNSRSTSFLDWLVANEIRRATEAAVREKIEEAKPQIAGIVAERMKAGDFADRFAEAVVGCMNVDWRLSVKFERGAR